MFLITFAPMSIRVGASTGPAMTLRPARGLSGEDRRLLCSGHHVDGLGVDHQKFIVINAPVYLAILTGRILFQGPINRSVLPILLVHELMMLERVVPRDLLLYSFDTTSYVSSGLRRM